MPSWFFMTLYLCMVVTCEAEKVFTFSSNSVERYECIANHLSNNSQQYEQDEWITGIANLTAKRFFGKTIAKKVFNTRFSTYYYELSSKKIIHQFSKDRF